MVLRLRFKGILTLNLTPTEDAVECNDDMRELVEFALTSSYSGGEFSVIERMIQ